MIKKIITVFIIISISCYVSAQDSLNRKTFISINTGFYLPTGKDFNKIYGDIIFINGLSIGIPFSNIDLFLYGKAMYLKKNGIPIIYHFTFNNGIYNNYTTQDGSITIDYFIFNLGLQYDFKAFDNLKIITNAGLTLINSTEKMNNPVAYNSNMSGLSGLFFGFGLERSFSKFPISLFTECQYNSTWTILKTYVLDYSAININVGLRLYFNQIKRQ